MARTTITIPDNIYKSLKIISVMRSKTIGEVISELVEWEIARELSPEISEEQLNRRLAEADEEQRKNLGIDAAEFLEKLISSK